MRVGAVEYNGLFRIHAHVLAAGCAEATDLRAFRELLRLDADVRRAYEAEKRAILAKGVRDSTEYAKAKGAFVERVLANLRHPRGSAGTIRPRVRS
jgi:GrpB-like predicted nucleotidyltransferase (UPF0157 family)